jgi:hypothetical protein
MNVATQTSKSGYYQQNHVHHYGDHVPSNQASKAPMGPYLPQEVSNADFGRNGYTSQPSSRIMSPAMTSRQAPVDDLRLHSQQRGTQANAIAPSFQIPKSVNDSGGSLSELAAQVSTTLEYGSQRVSY